MAATGHGKNSHEQAVPHSITGPSAEFARAADRHPDLFFEKVAIGSPDRSRWEPRSVRQAFIEANRSQESQEEWHVWKDGRASGRFYGSLAGIEEFKRLAESLHLVLCEMVYREHGCYERCGFLECLERMYETAFKYPTPLLRVKFRNWGVDESIVDEKVLDDLAEQESPPADDRPPYPLHPLCVCLVHNVFTSTVAFIDAIMEPDKALLTGPIPSHFLTNISQLWPPSPPISLPKGEGTEIQTPKGDEEEIQTPKGEGTPAVRREAEDCYLVQRQGTAWKVCFEEEDAPFSGRKKLLPLARLLREPDRKIDAVELDREGIDVEREEKARQARSELPDKPQGARSRLRSRPEGNTGHSEGDGEIDGRNPDGHEGAWS